jgi:hypothetical protein
MTPFQAFKASFDTWLAKAREPIQERELAPVPSGATPRPSTAARSSNSRLKMTQTGRRKTDSPVQRDSFIQRSWTTIVWWIARPHTGTKR